MKVLKSGEAHEKGERQVAFVLERLRAAGVDPTRYVKTSKDGLLIVQKQATYNFAPRRKAAKLPTPNAESLKKLVSERGMPWRDDYLTRAVPYWASDERVDGMGDIVRQDWLYDIFEKNSPMPLSHDWGSPPVGRVVDWQVRDRSEKDYDGKALYLLCLFASDGDSAVADSVYRLVKSRVMVGGSVGFQPDRVVDIKDDKERGQLGLGKWGLIFEQNHLLEFSPCTIPANPGAVVPAALEDNASELRALDFNVLREVARRQALEESSEDAFVQLERALMPIARKLWPDYEFKSTTDLDEPVELVEKKLARVLVVRAPAPPPAGEEKPAPAPAPAEDPQAQPEKDPLQMLTEMHAGVMQMTAQINEVHAMVSSLVKEEGSEDPAQEPAPGSKPSSDTGAGGPPPAKSKGGSGSGKEGQAQVMTRLNDVLSRLERLAPQK